MYQTFTPAIAVGVTNASQRALRLSDICKVLVPSFVCVRNILTYLFLPIQVNGLSGKMGLETAKAALEAGLQLVPYSFTGRMGPDQGPLSKIDVEGVEVEVYGFGQRELAMDLCKQVSRRAVVIDYTVPAAVIGEDRVTLFHSSSLTKQLHGVTVRSNPWKCSKCRIEQSWEHYSSPWPLDFKLHRVNMGFFLFRLTFNVIRR